MRIRGETSKLVWEWETSKLRWKWEEKQVN